MFGLWPGKPLARSQAKLMPRTAWQKISQRWLRAQTLKPCSSPLGRKKYIYNKSKPLNLYKLGYKQNLQIPPIVKFITTCIVILALLYYLLSHPLTACQGDSFSPANYFLLSQKEKKNQFAHNGEDYSLIESCFVPFEAKGIIFISSAIKRLVLGTRGHKKQATYVLRRKQSLNQEKRICMCNNLQSRHVYK